MREPILFGRRAILHLVAAPLGTLPQLAPLPPPTPALKFRRDPPALAARWLLIATSMLSLRCFGVTACVGAECAPASPAQRIEIRNVTVIDVAKGLKMRDQTVVIDGERIRDVRPSIPFDAASEARQVDGSGKFLIPGLWDMHVHGNNDPWYSDWFPLYIANGVTGVREMFGPENADKFRADLAARHLDAPHIYLGSPIVDGDPPDWPNSAVVRSAQEARAFVDEQKARGADFIKVYNHLGRAEYYAIIDEAGRRHIPVSGHVPFAISAWEASAAGQVTLEHLFGLPTACSGHDKELQGRRAAARTHAERRAVDLEAFQTYDDARCAKLFSLLRRHGTWLVPTLAVFNADFVAAADTTHADPRLQYFSGEGLKWLRGDSFAYLELDNPAELAYARANFAYLLKVTGALFRAHTPILAGTDTGNAYTFPGFSLHEELALMVQAGATPLAALQAATLNPAVFMHRTDRYGSVSAGKIADLVMLDADPLIDIHNTSRIFAVFLAGREFDRNALDQLLRQAKATAAASN